MTIPLPAPDEHASVDLPAPAVAPTANPLEHAVGEVERVIVGQQRLLERVMCCLIAGGHVLLEGVPGVGKTRTISTFAAVVGGSFSRIQFTADLLPSDIVGTRVYRPSTETFDFEPGPVFANFVLADEINRAPAKVQSSLLEVMEERQVTVGGHTRRLPAPFLVLATQNPAESDGVFPLPDAQRDRFMMRVEVPLPSPDEERTIVERFRHGSPTPRQLLSVENLVEAQQRAVDLDVPAAVTEYMVRLTVATRDPAMFGLDDLCSLISAPASPRATISMDRAARALAVLRGSSTVTAQDVYDVAYDVLNHRISVTFDAYANGVTAHDIITRILTTIPG